MEIYINSTLDFLCVRDQPKLKLKATYGALV